MSSSNEAIVADLRVEQTKMRTELVRLNQKLSRLKQRGRWRKGAPQYTCTNNALQNLREKLIETNRIIESMERKEDVTER